MNFREYIKESKRLQEAEARFSDAFQFSYEKGCEEGEEKLKTLKKEVEAHNKEYKDDKKKVVIVPRLAKDDPKANKYADNQSPDKTEKVNQKDAAILDVYVHSAEQKKD